MKTEKTQSVPDIEPLVIKRFTGKPIHQYSMEGKYIKTFNSISEAARELDIRGGTLNKCLKGILKSCKGYQWRYAE
jgi:hypothetical protein